MAIPIRNGSRYPRSRCMHIPIPNGSRYPRSSRTSFPLSISSKDAFKCHVHLCPLFSSFPFMLLLILPLYASSHPSLYASDRVFHAIIPTVAGSPSSPRPGGRYLGFFVLFPQVTPLFLRPFVVPPAKIFPR